MSDWNVHLVSIGKFGNHPNADTLSITQVYGSPVIFKRDTYKPGDLAVFIPPDSCMPTDPESVLLKDNPHMKPGQRVDAIRLRGIFSNGFLVPAHVLFTPEELQTMEAGTHVAERLGITKYEDAGDKLSTRGENERDGSGMPHYTDIKGWPTFRNSNAIKLGEEVVLTEKIHGCVDASTILETLEYGPMTIQKVVQNCLEVHVKSTNFEGAGIEYRKVIDWSELPENDNWYEIELTNGQILKITGNHEIWLPSLNCWRSVEYLVENDELSID